MRITQMSAEKKATLRLCRCAPVDEAAQSTARSRHSGFNLLELLIVLSLVGVLATIAYPSYTYYVDKAHNAEAAADVVTIAQAIERFYVVSGRYPDSLAEIALDGMLDPWGDPYQYLRIYGGGLKGKGKLRKDKSLVPVNSDFDLYSMGKDGASAAPFTAKAGRDDIVRANNGRYIGPAADY